jgi:hypothetical protein
VVAVLMGLSVLLVGGEWIVRARPAAVVPCVSDITTR